VTSRNFQTGVNGSFRVLFGTGFHQMKVVCFSQGTVAVDKFVIQWEWVGKPAYSNITLHQLGFQHINTM